MSEEGVVIHDSTAGIWVYSDKASLYSPGDELEVRGVIAAGKFAPVVNASSIYKVGRAPLPRPKKVSFRQLSSGDMDAQYVTVSGLVHSVGIRKQAPSSEKLSLKIQVGEGYVTATLPWISQAEVDTLVDARVQITATAMCSKNNNRQIIAPILAASGMKSIIVLKSPRTDPYSKPLILVSRLMQYRSGTDLEHRVHVAGRVTYYEPGESLIIEDGQSALKIKTNQDTDLSLGDRVTALGFPALEDSGPILEDAVFQRVSAGPPLLPTSVKLPSIRSGRLHYNLISTEGRLVRQLHEPSREVLLIQDGTDILLAELDSSDGKDPLRTIPDGSVIRVSGISMLEVGGTWNYGIDSAKAVRCKLLLRSPGDVQVLKPPTWWTIRHLLYVAVALGILALLFLVQVIRSLAERWQLQTVLAERERLAHAIHDTLAQSFAGIGFQLQAIRRALPQELPDVRRQVELAQVLVRHSHKEARRSIEPLRTEPEESAELLPSLEKCARTMVEGGSVEVSTIAEGKRRPLPPHVTTALLRIGQEAIANAVRHADPSHLEISLVYKSNLVTLSIQDDGIGFVKRGDLLGFGLRGMRERAAGISANLEIRSQPGSGSCIIVNVRLPSTLAVAGLVRSSWTYLSERLSHVYTEPQPYSHSDRR